MEIEEIKIRQMANQHLTAPADKLTVVRDLCGIQAQFMANAMHSLKIRCLDYEEDTLKNGLVKNWSIRGTVHVFAETDLPLFIRCNEGKDYRRNEWHGYTFWNQRDKWALTPERQKYLSDVILSALAEHSCTREELKEICRAKGMTEAEESSMFDPWGGGIRELCERGFMNYVVQEKKAFCLSPEFTPMPKQQAKLEIARRYFTHMAPATIHDAMYYFHVSATQVKEWLSELPVQSTECAGRIYYFIPASDEPKPCLHGLGECREGQYPATCREVLTENPTPSHVGIPKCIFLAGFDQLMLAYEKNESLYLPPEHMRDIFNLAGIVMPALMLDGQVAGKWKKRNKKLMITLFSHVNTREKALIEEEAASLWGDISAVEFV